MNRQTAPTAHAQDEPANTDEDEGDGSDEDADSPACLIYDISYIPLYTRSRSAQASFAMEEGVEIAPCTSWMKQHILLSLFRPVYQVVFRFRSCPTCVV